MVRCSAGKQKGLGSILPMAMKSRKGLAHDLSDTLAIHSNFTYDVTDTDCWSYNGSTHSRVFMTFTKNGPNQVEKHVLHSYW